MIRKIEYECGRCGHRFLVTGDEKGPLGLTLCPLCGCSYNTWISECTVQRLSVPSSCEECPGNYWNGKFCEDKEIFFDGSGDLVCRYHPEAKQ